MKKMAHPMSVLTYGSDVQLTFHLQSSDTKLLEVFKFVLTLENRMWGMIAAKVWLFYCSRNQVLMLNSSGKKSIISRFTTDAILHALTRIQTTDSVAEAV